MWDPEQSVSVASDKTRAGCNYAFPVLVVDVSLLKGSHDLFLDVFV